VNIPGTIDEHPNWPPRLPIDLEDLRSQVGWLRSPRHVAAGR